MAAHLAGFVAGALLTLPLTSKVRGQYPAPEASLGLRSVLGGLSAVFGIGLVTAVGYAATYSPEKDLTNWEGIIRHERTRPTFLNQFAWHAAIEENTVQQRLQLAEEAAQRAHRQLPHEGAYRDTLATVLYRLGRYDEAIVHQKSVLEAQPSGEDSPLPRMVESSRVYATQLGRFLAARLESGIDDESFPSLEILKGSELELRIPSEHGSGLNLYALAQRGQRTVGLLRVQTRSGLGGAQRFILKSDLDVQAGVHFRVVLAESSSGADLKEEIVSHYWPSDPTVSAYP